MSAVTPEAVDIVRAKAAGAELVTLKAAAGPIDLETGANLPTSQRP